MYCIENMKAKGKESAVGGGGRVASGVMGMMGPDSVRGCGGVREMGQGGGASGARWCRWS